MEHGLHKPVVDEEALIRVTDALVEHKEVLEGVEEVVDGLLRALDKLGRFRHHHVIVNDTQPVAGPSTIDQKHTVMLAAMTI